MKEAADKKTDAAAAIDEAGKKSAEAKSDLEKNMKAAVEESEKTAKTDKEIKAADDKEKFE